MDNSERESIWKSGIEGGLILTGIFVVQSLLFFVLGIENRWVSGGMGLVLWIAGLTWVQIRFRVRKNGGYLSYGRAYGFAMISGLYLAVLFSVYNHIFINYIDTEFIDRMLNMQYQSMVDSGASEAIIEQQMIWAEMGTKPMMLFISTLIWLPISTAFFGLISSAIAMKKPKVG